MNDQVYERRELRLAYRESLKWDSSADGQLKYRRILSDPEWTERIGDLILDGAYGHGVHLWARRSCCHVSKRVNRTARLGHLIAGFECGINLRAATRVWKTLDAKTQKNAEKALTRSIEDCETMMAQA